MKFARVIYHLARADFLERVRRYGFLLMLGLVLFLGYQAGIGNLNLALGQYRGEFNSAWVGAMMALIGAMFIGWFGFFLVKGSVARDRETGVGQIIATTPLTRPLYLLGKWLSNFTVLMTMVTVLALAGIAVQFWKGENAQIDLIAFLEPFILIVLPLMALVAAIAVLFETISFLQGGFGNLVYFIAFVMLLPLFIENKSLRNYLAFEPVGIKLMATEMGKEVIKFYPDYNGTFTLGTNGAGRGGSFLWTGVNWTPSLIFGRMTLFVSAILLTLFASLFFDRFDPSASKPRQTKNTIPRPNLEPVLSPRASPIVQLTPINAAANRFSFFTVLTAEFKLLIKGQPWWWYVIAGGILIACLANPSATVRRIVLPIAWVWPLLMWSAMGNRELHNNVQQMTFSSASPLLRQLPAQWLAGLIVTLLISLGAVVRFTIDGDTVGLLALLSGMIFIPSLALASGVWSGSSKLFEILYIAIWYLGPLNNVPALDYIGSHGNGRPGFFILISLALIAFAVIGRAKQIRH
jgi:hypothetical protein